MISKISVCLEVGPQATGAFAPEYPGCWVYGRNEKNALQEIKIALTEWVGWLKSYGESVLDIDDNAAVKVTEMLRVDYDPSETGKPEPLFWSEVGPVTRDDIDKTIRLMKYSRNDLEVTLAGKSEDCMDWEPPAQFRTIRNCLIHIAHAELWYITRLNIATPEKLPESPFELLDYSRGIAVKCLQALPERKMKGIFQPRKYRSPKCNLWTARKVLRRLVDHERLHTRDIKKVLELKERRSLS